MSVVTLKGQDLDVQMVRQCYHSGDEEVGLKFEAALMRQSPASPERRDSDFELFPSVAC